MAIPESAANKLLDELKVTQEDLLKYLDEIALERGALVVEGNLDGSEARLNMAGKPAIITVSRRTTNISRRRFSVAHELGHLEMHRWKITLCTSVDMMEWSVNDESEIVEQEANEFAAALLMPERFFGTLCEEEPTFEYFSELATQFHVSLTAASVRYCYFTPEPMAIVFSQDGIIRWFRASKEFVDLELFVNVRSRVYAGSKAALFFSGKPIPTKPNRIEADAWLREGNYDRQATIREQSRAMENYNAVVTLLWIDEDIESSDDW